MASFGITQASMPGILLELDDAQLVAALKEQTETVSELYDAAMRSDDGDDSATSVWSTEALIKLRIEDFIKTKTLPIIMND